MMTTTFRKHISIGIIWCLMVSSVGCYSLQSIQDPGALNDQTLFVATSEKMMYELEEWEILEDGGVCGKGIQKRYLRGSDVPMIVPFEGALEVQQIKGYYSEELSTGRTISAVIGIAALAGGIIYLTTVRIDMGGDGGWWGK